LEIEEEEIKTHDKSGKKKKVQTTEE